MLVLKRIRFAISFAVLIFAAGATRAAAQATCSATALPNTLRSQGITEALPLITLANCSGAIPAAGSTLELILQPASIVVTNSTDVVGGVPIYAPTAVVTTSSGVTILRGTISTNTVNFSLPANPGGATLTSIQIGAVAGVAGSVPIRVNAASSGATASNPITGFVFSTDGGLAINSAPLRLSTSMPGISAAVKQGAAIPTNAPILVSAPPTATFAPVGTSITQTATNTTTLSTTASFSIIDNTTAQAVNAPSVPVVSIGENFASALRVAGATGEGTDTSGIGTRVLISLQNIPTNVAIYAPLVVTNNTVTSQGTLQAGSLTLALVTGTDLSGFHGQISDVNQSTTTTAALVTGNFLVYEVVASSNTNVEQIDVPLGLYPTAISTSSTIGANVFLAPTSTVSTAACLSSCNAAPIPVPRFVATAAPALVPPGTPLIAVSSSDFEFSATPGVNTAPQTLKITNLGGGLLNWTVAITSISGGNWLTISPTSGTGDGTASLSVNASSLAAGTYTATLSVTSPGAGNTQTVTVNLSVVGATLLVTPSQVSFAATTITAPSPQQLSITSSSGVLSWTAQVSSSATWLTVFPLSGNTGTTAIATAHTAGLAPGNYSATITFSAVGAAASVAVPVSLTLTAVNLPTISQNGIVNAASFSQDAVVASGSLASMFGANLAGSTASTPTIALPFTLGSTQVLVNDNPVPLLYVSGTQINFLLPPSTPGPTAQVVVVSNGVRGTAATLNVAAAAPGIFTNPPGGTGQGAVLNQDSSLNSSANPAAVGTVLQIFATGLGAVQSPPALGQPAGSSPPSLTVVTPVVLIGGIPAQVTFSGLAPNTVGGYQVNARIPAGTPSGSAVSLQILVPVGGGVVSSNVVTVAIR